MDLEAVLVGPFLPADGDPGINPCVIVLAMLILNYFVHKKRARKRKEMDDEWWERPMHTLTRTVSEDPLTCSLSL